MLSFVSILYLIYLLVDAVVESVLDAAVLDAPVVLLKVVEVLVVLLAHACQHVSLLQATEVVSFLNSVIMVVVAVVVVVDEVMDQ